MAGGRQPLARGPRKQTMAKLKRRLCVFLCSSTFIESSTHLFEKHGFSFGKHKIMAPLRASDLPWGHKKALAVPGALGGGAGEGLEGPGKLRRARGVALNLIPPGPSSPSPGLPLDILGPGPRRWRHRRECVGGVGRQRPLPLSYLSLMMGTLRAQGP